MGMAREFPPAAHRRRTGIKKGLYRAWRREQLLAYLHPRTHTQTIGATTASEMAAAPLPGLAASVYSLPLFSASR